MKKQELIAKVAEEAGVTKKTAALVVDTFLKVVSDALAKGETVRLVGFGTFTVRQRAARKGINPQTKQTIQIPARKVPVFRPSTALKDRVK
ncbi:MAG: HU family DNA-binding protein [Candidatus Hydrothermae bacterium]|jgi:DNA-binding protein HU-beta|nr:HU family DNA-binding protein [Candidatus Hydrothermae bacterium]